MTSITTNIKHRVRTTGSEHQGQTSISDPDQSLGCICIYFIRYVINYVPYYVSMVSLIFQNLFSNMSTFLFIKISDQIYRSEAVRSSQQLRQIADESSSLCHHSVILRG